MKIGMRYALPLTACLLVAAGEKGSGAGTASGAQQAPSSGAPGAAGQPSPAGAGSAAGAAREGKTWVMGNIIEVKKDSVAINTENGRMRRLKLNDRTDVVIDGKKASTSDLKAGAPVMASYEGTGAQATATRLEVDESRRSHPASGQGTGSSVPQGAGQESSGSPGK